MRQRHDDGTTGAKVASLFSATRYVTHPAVLADQIPVLIVVRAQRATWAAQRCVVPLQRLPYPPSLSTIHSKLLVRLSTGEHAEQPRRNLPGLHNILSFGMGSNGAVSFPLSSTFMATL